MSDVGLLSTLSVPPTTWEECKATIGHVIPCYSEVGGCRLEDEAAQEFCTDGGGCLMLRIWKHGFKSGQEAN